MADTNVKPVQAVNPQIKRGSTLTALRELVRQFRANMQSHEVEDLKYECFRQLDTLGE